MKILIIALSGIGDALMFSPALKLLRQRYPDAHIDLLTMFKGVDEMYRRNPDISNVLFWNFLKENPFSSLNYVLNLRRKRYDVSINIYPANRWHYNIISFIIGATKRLGHDYNHVNLRSLNFLHNYRIFEDDLKHNVEENHDLIKYLGVDNRNSLSQLQVILSDEDKKKAESWLISNSIPENSFIVGFHAGSAVMKNHINRRWAPDKYAQLGKLLIEKYKAKILLFGGPDEYALNENINRMMGGKGIVVTVPTFIESVSIMQRCSVFVVNDSGLMHVAAGLELPIVTIFAYTNPNYVYPWKTKHIMVRHDLECSPCFYYSPRHASCKWKEDKFRCITHIEVEEVYSAVEKISEKIDK